MCDNERPVGAVAVYAAPDDLVAAITEARRRGFTRIDAVSPYPLHGIDALLGKGPSRLGYVALGAGLLAVAAAKTMQWWMSAVDYPLNVGGKPLFSWPAFVPVTFELMVLVTAITTVITMVAVLNRLPTYRSALLGSRSMARLTCDRYGLVVDARDPLFAPDTIERELAAGNRLGVELLYRPAAPQSPPVFSPAFAALLVLLAIGASAATYAVFRHGGGLPLFDFMKTQARLTPQRLSPEFANGLGMQIPADGAVAQGQPLAATLTPEQSAALPSPVPLDAASVARGRSRFSIYCRPCHGVRARGDGTLTAAYPKAPSLHSLRVREWSDGRVFHVITNGQNVMPSYASQMSAADRWHTVHFLRALQRSHNALDRDFQ